MYGYWLHINFDSMQLLIAITTVILCS